MLHNRLLAVFGIMLAAMLTTAVLFKKTGHLGQKRELTGERIHWLKDSFEMEYYKKQLEKQ